MLKRALVAGAFASILFSGSAFADTASVVSSCAAGSTSAVSSEVASYSGSASEKNTQIQALATSLAEAAIANPGAKAQYAACINTAAASATGATSANLASIADSVAAGTTATASTGTTPGNGGAGGTGEKSDNAIGVGTAGSAS